MKAHFVGVGGKGIAPAASLALQAGYTVTGDDLIENHRTQAIRDAGATVNIGDNNLPAADACDLVVATAAFARVPNAAWGIRRVERLQFVQQVFSECQKDVLAVCGTVGKSTAASVLWSTLSATHPSCYIGADIDGLLCGARLDSGQWAITEACEYRDAYFALDPRVLMLLNIAPNHEDFFGPGTQGFSASIGRLLSSNAGTIEHLVVSSDAAATLEANDLRPSGHTVGYV